MNKKELHQLAVESLNEGLRLDDWDKIGCVNHDCDKCKALAEKPAPAQEPVAWQFFQGGKWHNGMELNDHRKHTEAAGLPVRDLYPPPPAQPAQQEPVAYLVTGPYEKRTFPNLDSANAYCSGLNKGWGEKVYTVNPLYTTPQAQTRSEATLAREWVGLTDEDKEFIELTGGKSDVLLAELVETKLKEKNT